MAGVHVQPAAWLSRKSIAGLRRRSASALDAASRSSEAWIGAAIPAEAGLALKLARVRASMAASPSLSAAGDPSAGSERSACASSSGDSVSKESASACLPSSMSSERSGGSSASSRSPVGYHAR